MEEKTFYRGRGVIVTNARFVVPSQTYAVKGITSVSYLKGRPGSLRTFSYLVGGFGLIITIAGSSQFYFSVILVGIAIIAFAVWIWKLDKAKYYVILKTSSGETKALESGDYEFISSVISALNEAIAYG